MITDPDDFTRAVEAMAARYLRPADTSYLLDGVPTWLFVPPLTAAEQAVLADLKSMARSHITTLTLAEYQALKPTLAGLATYRDLASPTSAQSVAAIKGIIDVLRALVTG